VKRVEIAIEVGPLPPETVERLKAAGHAVFRGNTSWRVQTVVPVISPTSVRAQAYVEARAIVAQFGLPTLSDPPEIILRDPDGPMDTRPDLILEDARRAEDRPPMARAPRKWWQRAMELGLGERKGD